MRSTEFTPTPIHLNTVIKNVAHQGGGGLVCDVLVYKERFRRQKNRDVKKGTEARALE